MARKQLRRTISVSEEAYVMLEKIAKRGSIAMSAYVERHIRDQSARDGIEVTEHDILESRVRRRLASSKVENPETPPADPADA